MPDCLKCGEELEPDEFPFGDDVTCKKCGTVHTTEMEEDWDSLIWWVTGIKEEIKNGKN